MANKFNLTLVTPDGKKHQDEVDILNIKTTAGNIGILANHLPLVAILEISHLNYKKDGKINEFSIGGGIINFKNNSAQVLVESFENKEEIDLKRAEESKIRAEKRISSKDDNIDIKRAEISLKRAINRIKLVK